MTHSTNDSPGVVHGGVETRDLDVQETFWFFLLFFVLKFFHFSSYDFSRVFENIKFLSTRRL